MAGGNYGSHLLLSPEEYDLKLTQIFSVCEELREYCGRNGYFLLIIDLSSLI